MPLILDAMVQVLGSRFPSRAMRVEPRGVGVGSATIVFPAAHPDVGELVITDDLDEATVYVGEITHGHFENDDEGMSERERAEAIAESVAIFVETLFADRVLLWSALGGTSGGWRIEDAPVVTAPSSWFRRWFVWSKPLDEARPLEQRDAVDEIQ